MARELEGGQGHIPRTIERGQELTIIAVLWRR
jgi:hypothetical protein